VDYIGFGITILSASYSHLLSGDGLLSLELLVRFAALIVSYLCMPQAHIAILPRAMQDLDAMQRVPMSTNQPF
jgi:hypothetical protein